MFRADCAECDGYEAFFLYDLHHQFTLRLTSPNGQSAEMSAVMSPDQQHLALTAASNNVRILRLMQFDERWQHGDEFAMLMSTREHQWYSPAWSRHLEGDVMSLAFTTNWEPGPEASVALDFDIWVFDVPARRWQEDDMLQSGPGIVPPIGEEILATGRRLTDDDYYDYEIAWSPDGSQMAFVSDRDLNFEIYVLDTSGVNRNIRRITNHLAPDLHPSWSPDGQWLVFASERDSNSELYVVSVNGGEPRRLTDNEARNVEPVWSPDGAYIAYIAEGFITLIRPDGSGFQPLFPGRDVTWMP
jgi:WD40 repeat protein